MSWLNYSKRNASLSSLAYSQAIERRKILGFNLFASLLDHSDFSSDNLLRKLMF